MNHKEWGIASSSSQKERLQRLLSEYARGHFRQFNGVLSQFQVQANEMVNGYLIYKLYMQKNLNLNLILKPSL